MADGSMATTSSWPPTRSKLLREVRRTKPGSEAGRGPVGPRDDEVGHADTAEQLDPLRQRPQAAAMLAVP